MWPFRKKDENPYGRYAGLVAQVKERGAYECAWREEVLRELDAGCQDSLSVIIRRAQLAALLPNTRAKSVREEDN